MDELRYVPESGSSLRLNYKNGFAVSLDGGSGTGVEISVSQGFGQTGESVDAMAVKGRTLSIRGVVLHSWQDAKSKLMAAFRPMSSGRLWWNDQRWIDVVVRKSPTLTNEITARFTVTLFAPYPFWQGESQNQDSIGVTTPNFRFPVNYGTTHRFGTTNRNAVVDIVNSGNMATPFRLTMLAVASTVTNPKLINVTTGEHLSFTKEMASNSTITMYTQSGRLYLKYNSSNAFDILDDDSDFFTLSPGINKIKAEADTNGDKLAVTLSYYDMYEGVYFDGTYAD